MKQKTEAVLLKEIRRLKRELRDAQLVNKNHERRAKLAEVKIDTLNRLIKTNDDTIQRLREDVEHARSLHPFNP